MRVRKTFYPALIYWEVTDLCNHNCIHCFNYWRTDEYETKEHQERNSDFYLKIAKKIIKQNPDKVVLTGGEPLVVFESLKPSIELFLNKEIEVGINTNGALLSADIADYLQEKGIGLFVSFPSADEAEFHKITDRPNAYAKVIESLELARNKGIRFATNMVVSKVNLHSIYHTAHFLKKKYNLRYMSITRVSKPINATEDFKDYLLTKQEFDVYLAECVRIEKELQMHIRTASPIPPCSVLGKDALDLFAYKNSCTAGKTSCVISSTGMVRACVRDAREYGNILEEKFRVIWKRMHEWRSGELLPNECKKCFEKKRCRGRCVTDILTKCKLEE